MSSYLMNVNIFIPSIMLGVVLYLVSFVLVFYGCDWFLVWLGFEFNMIGYIVLCININSSFGVESLFKYYFIQVVASGLFLMLMLMGDLIWLVVLVLGLKMGLGPFFYWFVMIVDGLSTGACILLMTVQKVLPIYMISVLGGYLVVYMGLLSVVFGSLGSFGVKSVSLLFAYSSIHHLGWMVLIQWCGGMFSLTYLLIYSMMTSISLFWILDGGLRFVGESGVDFSFIMVIFSLGGVPPLLGFFLKWYGFLIVLGVDILIGVMLFITSVIMLYIYIRLVVMDLMIVSFDTLWSMWISKFWGVIEVFHLVGGFVIVLLLF